ncbi:MAG: DUF202 domain-containing protein [Candidatus Eremiobacteraeota bacterium]|nr:DUF202 domain-containing protein [Candidatus Eremiobacteraeota bacterium]MBV8595642.1 DUF202 domain-containing protein [Candidatus Eremiobacteraeota bacterium]MBV8669004.1 DUF202 domain-containing protein [Candidatus Eremiobacteraeota bacterium]
MSQLPTGTPQSRGGVRDHLANERTYLANLRTAIALVSFGITINRFSLFLLEKQLLSRAQFILLDHAESLGIVMVFAGMALLMWGAVHFAIISNQIDTGTFRPSKRAIGVITILVLALSAISLYWLFQR